jgi:hypothetical protein
MSLARLFVRMAVPALAVALLVPSQAAAQDPHPVCDVAGVGGNACQLSVDLFHYMNPQLGMLIAGGNATLGQGGVLGGLGKFAITLRANATQEFAVPQLEDVDASGTVAQNHYETKDQIGGFPVADAAIGLWAGIPLGITKVGGIDALVNVFYVPTSLLGALDGDQLSVAMPDGGMRLGYGVRVGVVKETAMLPGVSVTYLQRNLPKVSFVAETDGAGTPDTVSVDGLEVRTTAWRLVAGKKLGPIAVAVGYGQDSYRTSATLGWAVHQLGGSSGELAMKQTVTRDNMFADLSLNLFLFRLVGEVGRVSGGSISTYNTFDSAPDKARTYGALGIRIGN